MNDIFVSYAREDRSTADNLTAALKSQGYSVWWDREIPTGRDFDEEIATALNAAHCVIVVWSRNSVVSGYTKSEASVALEQNKLLPVQIDRSNIPLEFRRLETIDLRGWSGERHTASFAKLLADVAAMIKRPSGILPQVPPFQLQLICTVSVCPFHFDDFAFSQDGNMIGSAWWEENVVRLWSVWQGGRLICELKHPSRAEANCVEFTPDGTCVWTAMVEGFRRQNVKLYLWRLIRSSPPIVGKIVRKVKLSHRDRPIPPGISFSPDTSLVVTSDAGLTVWNTSLGERVFVRTQADGRDVVFSQDSSVMAAMRKGAIELWNLRTGKHLPDIDSAASWLALDSDGRTLAASGVPGTDWQKVHLWNVVDGQHLGVLEPADFPIAFSPNGSLLATGFEQKKSKRYEYELLLWNVSKRKLALAQPLPDNPSIIKFIPDGTGLGVADSTGTIQVWRFA